MIAKWALLLIVVGLLNGANGALGQEQFYRGKVVRVIVGFPPGGGYDTYARLIARHMGKYVAGNPTIVVDNMSGAGSMISANHVFRVAKPDGLTIGHFIGGLFLQQILGKPGIEFDARKFEYIGAPAQDNFIMGLHKNTGFTSVQQWVAAKTVVKFGGAGFGAGTDDLTAVARDVMGCRSNWLPATKAPPISAWPSTTARSSASPTPGSRPGPLGATNSTAACSTSSLQLSIKSHAELTKYPLPGDLIKTDEGRTIFQAVAQVHGASVRPFVLPPNTPKERVQMLRKAFMDTLATAISSSRRRRAISK